MNKKFYNQPSVESTQILSCSMVMAGSNLNISGEPITNGGGGD